MVREMERLVRPISYWNVPRPLKPPPLWFISPSAMFEKDEVGLVGADHESEARFAFPDIHGFAEISSVHGI